MELNDLLLRTAFACMSCDGDIANEEIDLIKQMSVQRHLFGDVDINVELDKLVQEINLQGKGFLKRFLISLAEQTLTEEQEIMVADVAVQTIQSDNKVEYSEIKFFKVLRSNFKVVTDETLLEKIDGLDENYLAGKQVKVTVTVYVLQEGYANINASAEGVWSEAPSSWKTLMEKQKKPLTMSLSFQTFGVLTLATSH